MTKAAVLYARGSTEEQVKDYSLRQQIAACLAWCEAEGY
jgi:DNA invertase Pin-like site-specific DNA recombinase